MTYINYKQLIDNLDKLDVETFYQCIIGKANNTGNVCYINVKYNKEFAKPNKEPVYVTAWGYDIDFDNRVTYGNLAAINTEKTKGKTYCSGTIPSKDNPEHHRLTKFLLDALIHALKNPLTTKTSPPLMVKEIKKKTSADDFATESFTPHYAESYEDKETGNVKVVENPGARFAFDSSTYPNSDYLPEELSGKVKSRILAIPSAKDVKLMKENNKNKLAARYEKLLPEEDDDEETILNKLKERYLAGPIPRIWDENEIKPAKAIGGRTGTVFGKFNFPGTVDYYGGKIRVRPSFGECVFIPDSAGSSQTVIADDDEAASFASIVASKSKITRAPVSKKNLDDSDNEEEEAPKRKKKSNIIEEPKKKKIAVVEDEEEEEEEIEPPKKPAKKQDEPPKKSSKKPVKKDEDDEEEEEIEPPKKPAKKPAKKVVVEDDSEEDDE